jgi:hypothetical protein
MSNSSRSYQGVDKVRRLLRKIEPEMTQGIRNTIEKGAKAIEADMLMGVPVDQGDLARSISYKLGRDGFTAYIGPGADRAKIIKTGFKDVSVKYTKAGNLSSASIKDKHALMQLFKAHWIEHGTKPHGNHPGRTASPFLNPAFDANKSWILRELEDEIDGTIAKAARS